MNIILDLETDNLLYECTKIHCAVLRYQNADECDSNLYEPKDIDFFIKVLKERPKAIFVGHNIFGFDNEVLKKLYGIDLTKTNKVVDTYIMSQVLFTNLVGRDLGDPEFPKKYVGKHSLAAWGHRLKCYKGDYQGGFAEYKDEMGEYCVQDTLVTLKLYEYICSEIDKRTVRRDCLELEDSIAPIIARQMAYGVLFNRGKAEELLMKLTCEKAKITQQLQQIFKQRVVNLGEVTPKAGSKKYGTKMGCTYTKIKFEEYKPSSRQQTIDRLIKEFGWNPQEFTDKGNPEFDEDIIESLPFGELEPLKNYYIIDKRIGQLEKGKQSWLNHVKDNNRIYGSVMQSGTATRRFTHFSPNLAQVPSNDKLFGKECRELFCVPKGKIMIGCDADALEMRTLAGYLKPFDNGRFIKTLLEGKKEHGTDMHSINASVWMCSRDCAKVMYYAMIYGAANAKLGLILQQFGIDIRSYVTDFDKQFAKLKKWAEEKETGFSDKYLECLLAGKAARELYGEKQPELPALIKDVQAKWKTNGYLMCLDGGKLFPRSEHSAFNMLNQSCGAIIMKKALQIADEKLQLKLVAGKDYEFILNVHDELQLEVTDEKEIVDYVEQSLLESIIEAGQVFNWPTPMKGNIMKGYDWASTH